MKRKETFLIVVTRCQDRTIRKVWLPVGSKDNKISKPPLYLIEKPINSGSDFLEDLSSKSDLAVRQFATMREALGADIPSIVIADMKTIGDISSIERLKTRFLAPVIILSDRPSMANAVKAMRAGAVDFFPKPASASAIAERIHGLLKQVNNGLHQSNATPFEAGPLRPFWEQERDIIETALNACNGNISRAAVALQISPSTIYRKKQSWDAVTGK